MTRGEFDLTPERVVLPITVFVLVAAALARLRRSEGFDIALACIAWVMIATLEGLGIAGLPQLLGALLPMLVLIPLLGSDQREFVQQPRVPAIIVFVSMGAAASRLVLGEVNWLVHDGDARLAGSFVEPNVLGAVLASCMLWLACLERRTRTTWIALGLGVLGLILSGSRGPWIGLAGGLAWIGWQQRRLLRANLRPLALAAALGVIVVSAALLPMLDRLHSIRSRLTLWNIAWSDVERRPFFGNGANSFQILHPEASALVGSSNDHDLWISSLPLAILHDFGLVGLVLFGALLTAPLFDLAMPRRLLGVRAAVVVLLVSSLFTTQHATALFWLIIAASYGAAPIALHPTPEPAGPGPVTESNSGMPGEQTTVTPPDVEPRPPGSGA
ncbi:MAG TPA: O-antigen ligase family protein [Candidatus Thermoplasmatota archaeon]|nr:O-antigen ligase family protein [Candidatus Thermoplasmatota archaeon]